MKNSQIHDGLDRKEIRDFLAITQCRLFEKSIETVQMTAPPDHTNLREWALKNIDEQIANLQRQKDVLRQRYALQTIIADNGWSEYDVSDDTTNDTGNKLPMNFIGTDEEYKSLMSKIYP